MQLPIYICSLCNNLSLVLNMQEYKGLYYNGDVVGEKNRTFRESLKRHGHWLSMRQGFQRVLSNSSEQWEMGSRRKDVLPSMGIRKRTADISLTKNYVSSEKASSELFVSFFYTDKPSHIFISFPFHSDSTTSHFSNSPPGILKVFISSAFLYNHSSG